jgi:speckle-type POZ protein
VKAKYKVSLLDHDGKPVPSYIQISQEARDFSMHNSWGFREFIKRVDLEESEHLKDDSFTVRIDVTIMSEFYAQETPSILVPPSDMHQHFRDLLSSKAGVDVEFLVGGETFSAHRSVLAARSPVFRAQFFGPMKEGTTTTEAICIDDMEAQVFNALLTFMYTDALPDIKQPEESAMFQHLLVAADMYRLDRLKLICEDKLCSGINTSSVATTLALAEQHHCHGLKVACWAFLLSSSTNLNAVLHSDGFEYLIKSHPDAVKDLLRSKVASTDLGEQD